MKGDEKLTRERILEILDCKNNSELNDRIFRAKYDHLISATQVINSIMFLWEEAGYVIEKKKV